MWQTMEHFWSIEDFQLITFYTAVLKYCSTTTHTLFICISHGNYNKMILYQSTEDYVCFSLITFSRPHFNRSFLLPNITHHNDKNKNKNLCLTLHVTKK
ncbi:unnamed protein product [Boreogadus saida]